jgi:glycosyltransferase involved in cell wall biosynthesis
MQFYAAVDRLALRAFDHVSTPSPSVSAILLRSGLQSEKVSLIRNGVDIECFRGAVATLRVELRHRDRRIVGFVGRLVRNKGGETLLHAAHAVLAAEKKVLFVFVGEGPCREKWQALAAELGIADDVIFTGTRTDMPGVYASFDVFVLPSFDEAMPMSLLEAMSSGIPTIATPVGGVPDVVVDGETGILATPGDVTGLTRDILGLLQDPEKARRIGEKGFHRVTQEFSSEAMARKYLQIYEHTLSVRNPNLCRGDQILE